VSDGFDEGMDMASSSEAFEKFSKWKNRKTSLRVTMIERGETEVVFRVVIDALDEDASQVGILAPDERKYGMFDIGESAFFIEPGRVVVSREDVEWLIFEEDD
jgi:hypothetical protein